MPETQPPQGTPEQPVICVLDTHIVLEAFWFADPRVLPVLQALDAGHLVWRATPPMRAELARVLPRLPMRPEAPQREHVLTSFDRWTALDERCATASRLTCTDPDDQMFVDLALGSRARWLFTRDHALLELARRATGFGCSIVPPERYPAAAAVTAGTAPGT